MTTLCEYNAKAEAPAFIRTLSQALNGNQEAIDCFQRVMGYALMANPVERILVIATGKHPVGCFLEGPQPRIAASTPFGD